MECALVYLVYIWVVLIHAFFIGICAFTLWGKRLISWSPLKVVACLSLPLIFLEFYWLPIVKYLGISLNTENDALMACFDLSSTDNLIDHVSVKWWHIISILMSAFFAMKIGRWAYLRNKKS